MQKYEKEIINVLDHGFVRLIDHMGGDLSISRAARQSYDAAWRTGIDAGKDEKLLKYLARNLHTSPFESVTLTFEVKAPIFVVRQWHRHRTASYNEISARYAELPEEFYIPDLDQITTQAKDNKQMRTNEPNSQGRSMREDMIAHNKKAFGLYRSLLIGGMPRELARTVLPTATYTRMFVTTNLMNLCRFISLRSHIHAQYEIRVYSDALLELIKQISPIGAPELIEAFKLKDIKEGKF